MSSKNKSKIPEHLAGKRIKIMLIEMEKEQQEMAEELGISNSYMTQICNDRRVARAMRQRISEIYKKKIPASAGMTKKSKDKKVRAGLPTLQEEKVA